MKLKKMAGLAIGMLVILLAVGCGSNAGSGAGEVKDGDYTCEVTLEGGSGRSTITSPCNITVKDGKYYAYIEWSSDSYDYMKIGEEKYLPINTEGNSVFELPVESLDKPLEVVADTTMMSTPHEIEYTIKFDKGTLK